MPSGRDLGFPPFFLSGSRECQVTIKERERERETRSWQPTNSTAELGAAEDFWTERAGWEGGRDSRHRAQQEGPSVGSPASPASPRGVSNAFSFKVKEHPQSIPISTTGGERSSRSPFSPKDAPDSGAWRQRRSARKPGPDLPFGLRRESGTNWRGSCSRRQSPVDFLRSLLASHSYPHPTF